MGVNESIRGISNHIVILGWSKRIERMVKELRNEVHQLSGDLLPILILTELQGEAIQAPFEKVYFIHGKPNDLELLRRANLVEAHSLLIPSQETGSEVSDGRNLFALFAVLSINPKLRVCLELSDSTNGETLQRIRDSGLMSENVEIVSFESVADRLLAQAAITFGITRVYDHLLSYGADSNEIYFSPISKTWIGKSFRALHNSCFDQEVILIGYQRAGELVINPKDREALIEANDLACFISYNRAAGLTIINPEHLSAAK